MDEIDRMSETVPKQKHDFIRDLIRADLADSAGDRRVITRFPPEPNGYLHIGHAKAFLLNFGLVDEFADEAKETRCHLRMDDTNPTKEDTEYVESIKNDLRWLGCDWGDHFYFASDYYPKLYDFAVELIKRGLAYVDSDPHEKIRQLRGTLTEPGTPSEYRERSVEENLALFADMRAGKYKEGEHVLRARIDMAHPNLNMRDPVIYRIMHVSHHRTGDTWCIYPMYDFAHPLSDALEGITHSLCSLEFENHRPLYDWFVTNCSVPHTPKQREFARLNMSYTIMSKRSLQQLVETKKVDGWDDPRMPTLSGMRRRGYTPESIRHFIDRVGLTKTNSLTDVSLLEHSVREHLNAVAPRYMAVLNPIKLVITNYPEDKTEEMEAVNNPEDPDGGVRGVPFSRELYIERDDFMEDPPRKFFRLAPGREVRFRYAYWIKCTEVIKDDGGEIVEIHGTYDPETRSGNAPPDGRKVRATIHWVSAAHAKNVEARLYDRLFTEENPGTGNSDFKEHLNPDSLKVTRALVEPALIEVEAGEKVQFERLGYFCADSVDSKTGAPVFNRTVPLRDSWVRQANKGGKQKNKRVQD